MQRRLQGRYVAREACLDLRGLQHGGQVGHQAVIAGAHGGLQQLVCLPLPGQQLVQAAFGDCQPGLGGLRHALGLPGLRLRLVRLGAAGGALTGQLLLRVRQLLP